MRYNVGDLIQVKPMAYFKQLNLLEDFCDELAGKYFIVDSIYNNGYRVRGNTYLIRDCILEDYPDLTGLFRDGDIAYTTLLGEVIIQNSTFIDYPIKAICTSNNIGIHLTKEGFFMREKLGEIVLYPNKEKDWSYLIKRYNAQNTIRELTFEEIAEKFGIPKENIRIKDSNVINP